MASPLVTSVLKVLLIGSAGTGVVAAVSGVFAGTGAPRDPSKGFLLSDRKGGIVIGRASDGAGNVTIPKGANAFVLAYGDYCKWDNANGSKKVQRRLSSIGEYEVTTMEVETTNGKIICFKM